MPAAAIIPAGAGLIGSFLQSNSTKNTQKANESEEASIDNQIEAIYNRQQGIFNGLMTATNPGASLGTATQFYKGEVAGGLDPAVIGSANSQFQQENARNLSTMENQLSPYTPNKAGLISNFNNNAIMGNVSLQQQLAALNQQTRQQGAQGLTGIAQDVLGFGENVSNSEATALGGIASQFGQAGATNAANAWGSNPFAMLANLPWAQLLGGGTVASTGGGATTPGGTYGAPPPGVSGQPYPQPGQGGLGAPGGPGTIG